MFAGFWIRSDVWYPHLLRSFPLLVAGIKMSASLTPRRLQCPSHSDVSCSKPIGRSLVTPRLGQAPNPGQKLPTAPRCCRAPKRQQSCSFTTESPANKYRYYRPFCKAWPLIKACPGRSSGVAPEASQKGHSPEEQTNLTRRRRPAAGQVHPLSADLILFCVPHSLSDTIRRGWNSQRTAYGDGTSPNRTFGPPRSMCRGL